MRLITYKNKNSKKRKLGILSKDNIHVNSLEKKNMVYASMLDLIKNISTEQIAELQTLEDMQDGEKLTDVKVLAPIEDPERNIICVGQNYFEHARESSKFEKIDFDAQRAKFGKAIYFSKYVDCCIADGEAIPSHAGITQELDYEAELAIIIGKDAFNIAPRNVKEYIFGYTVINDVSARDLQIEHRQWFYGKSLQGFAPLGPTIVTADSISYPPELDVQAFVNGEQRQNSNTKLFIHSIDEIVSELSTGMLLKAGTIIATGTPAGVGAGFTPPKFLHHGDKVECIVENVGKLTNIVD